MNLLCLVFHHEESIKYSYELLNGIELYGQRLRLQHKETGLGTVQSVVHSVHCTRYKYRSI